MKKIYTILAYLLLILHCSFTSTTTYENNYTIFIAPFAHKVLKRFYLIERLKETIQTIAQIQTQIADQCDFLAGHNTLPYKGAVTKTFDNYTKTLRPLFMLWEDFSSYKRLNDELFVEEFTKEVFVVVKFKLLDDLHQNKQQTKTFYNNFDFADHVSVETRLDLITAIGNFLKDKTIGLNYLHHEIQSILTKQKKRFDDIPKNIESEHILQRLYHTERLRNQKTFLQCFKQLNINIFKTTNFKGKQSKKRIFDDQIIFYDHRIQKTVREMMRTNSLDPLILLLENFYEFIHIDNAEFIRETLIILFITQKNILINHMQPTKDATTVITQVIHLYNMINSLPIEEILNAIDTLTEALEDVAQEIEENSDSSSWWSKPFNTIMYVFNMITTHQS